jgi:hypothetical protein
MLGASSSSEEEDDFGGGDNASEVQKWMPFLVKYIVE